MHPLLSLQSLSELLNDYKDESRASHTLVCQMINQRDNNVEINLVDGLHSYPNTETAMKDYKIYATKKFNTRRNRTPFPRFDFVQVMFSQTDKPICQVLAILEITNHNTKTCHHLLVVTRMGVVRKIPQSSDTFLPFNLLAYQFLPRYLCPIMQIVAPETIFRPSLVIPDVDRGRKCLNKLYSHLHTRSLLFWGIKYKCIDRNGYKELSNITTPPNDGEETKGEEEENPLYVNNEAMINAYNNIQARLHGNEVDFVDDEAHDNDDDFVPD